MLNMSHHRGPYVILNASEWLRREDYQALHAQLIEPTAEKNGLRLLVDAVDFRGWQPAELPDTLKLEPPAPGAVERAAVVGDPAMADVARQILNPWSPGEVRFFPENNRTEALRWLGFVDPVDEAGEESFPASDPPSYSPI